MDDNDLKNIWKMYEQKLEEARVLNLQSWALNIRCFETLQQQKMKSKLTRLALFKIMMLVLGVPWTFFLGFLFVNSLSWPKIFFALSTGAVFFIYLYVIFEYIRHLVLINQISNSESIVQTQLKLAELKSATLRITRILFLQAPFYTTFFYTPKWAAAGDPGFWFIGVPVTLLFTAAAIWLYRNIAYKNAGKKWFRILFNSPEWSYVVQSMGFIQEIEAFKQNV